MEFGFKIREMTEEEIKQSSMEPAWDEPEAREFPHRADDGSYFEDNYCEVWVVYLGEEDRPDDCQIESEVPGNHWLHYELENFCPNDLLFDARTHTEIATHLLQAGVAPGQSFKVWMTASYTRDYWGEHDVEFQFDVLEVEEWDEVRVLTAWEAWLGRQYCSLDL